MDITKEVPLRALFEHDKSTWQDRKQYVTLGYIALPEGIFVKYYAVGYEEVAYVREVNEFAGISSRGTKRFEYLEHDVIDTDLCDYIASNAEEVFV